MPKKLPKKFKPTMSNTTTSWANRKKMLPKNWCQVVSETLTAKGFAVKADQVSDVRMGKIKNITLQIEVWGEISKLERKELRRRQKLAIIKGR